MSSSGSPPAEALRQATVLIGGQSQLARALGVRQSHVWYWLNRGNGAPAEYCVAIERATEGRITRQALRPEFDWGLPRECVVGVGQS